MMGALVGREDRVAIDAISDEETRYAGLVTRAIAFVLDAALIDLVAIVVAAGTALISSLLHFPKSLQTALLAIGAASYIIWSLGYFVAFWSTAGQTPGARVMKIRVVRDNGERLKPRRALLRCIGVVLAALPLFAGFVRILFDAKRRGFQDRLAGTLVVVQSQQLSLAQSQRRIANATYEARRRSTVT